MLIARRFIQFLFDLMKENNGSFLTLPYVEMLLIYLK